MYIYSHTFEKETTKTLIDLEINTHQRAFEYKADICKFFITLKEGFLRTWILLKSFHNKETHRDHHFCMLK